MVKKRWYCNHCNASFTTGAKLAAHVARRHPRSKEAAWLKNRRR